MKKYIEIFEKTAKEHNISYRYSFKSNVGRANLEKREVLVSKPINRDRLQTALHEISHILLNDRGIKEPEYVKEYLCDIMSFEFMRKEGISVSKKAIKRSKHYIAYMTQKAIHRGLKKVDTRVKSYIKKEYPKTAKGIYVYV